MKFNFEKKTAALALFGAALLLLIANLLVGIFNKTPEPNIYQSKINISGIDSLFLYSLHSFGINNDWIKETGNSKNIKSYLVDIPVDLSIPVVLAELNLNFSNKRLKIFSEEKNASGKTETKIYAGTKILLKSEFRYDDTIHRIAGTISFILSDYKLNDSEDSLLLHIPEPFSPLMPPSMKNFDIARFITEKKKTFSILLNDKITEIKYKLRDDYSQDRIKSTLFTIIKDFSGASFFVIDNNSDLFHSDIFKLIKGELDKRNIKLLELGNLVNLEYENELQIKNDFDYLIKNMGDGRSQIIVVNYEGFEKLIPEINRFKKIGYKVVHPSLLIQKPVAK